MTPRFEKILTLGRSKANLGAHLEVDMLELVFGSARSMQTLFDRGLPQDRDAVPKLYRHELCVHLASGSTSDSESACCNAK
eukprot:747002-Rhodomonas_salina.2